MAKENHDLRFDIPPANGLWKSAPRWHSGHILEAGRTLLLDREAVEARSTPKITVTAV